MLPCRCVHRHKHSCKTLRRLIGKPLSKDATLTSDTLQYKAVCSVRAAVFGHKQCEQIAVHMLLIELCRAPIAHCLQSQTEFLCLSFSVVVSLPSSSLPYGKKTCWEYRKINKAVPFQKSKQIIALMTDTLRLDRTEKQEEIIFSCLNPDMLTLHNQISGHLFNYLCCLFFIYFSYVYFCVVFR